ncbi:hypothetical protein PMY38_16000 [Clostridium tertium]|uniref:hypothetical protein n=1 Tax=Clostridium tertium TaxID=1559 RepID=UPI00232DC8BA|nr:hypothetical protein [Clostridium tertium]MDB1956931.1 hypothetical protein [Clostridium tertium]MDB1960103.1 hypothetical protein [Clostridium tertium]MDB1963888.1 hypothetical protein [Clostridium tertium]MDB1967951.1 hypothetical protein [Clostridium tertium]
MEIKVRNLSPKVVKTIDEMAKKKGYKSREEYLRNHFENLTALSEFKNFENEYKKLISICVSTIERNTEVMSKFLEENLIEL